MMNGKISQMVTIATMMSLAACGGTSDEGGKGQAKAGAQAAWNATDACALLDKADVGATLKDNVTETSLGLVNEAAGPNAATSECTYMLASGGRATFMTRWSPIADNTAEAIATTRKTTEASVAAFGKTVEDVSDLGKAAFFVPGINQMNVFLDDRKFVILTLPSASNAEGKTLATALIGKVKK